jgi:hypothetical protein
MMLPLLLTCLWFACITLCSRAIWDPAVLAVLLVMGYYMATRVDPATGAASVIPQCLSSAYWLPMAFAAHALKVGDR